MSLALRLLGAAVLGLGLVACGLHVANSGQAPVPPQPTGTLRVATQNVHYIVHRAAEGRWSLGDWHRRRDALDAAFKAVGADLFAFQEMETFQGGDDGSLNLARDFLLERNPLYAAAASGDWRESPSTQPILYRTDRLRLLGQGWFFFSETPDVIYSRTFDGSFPAFASWARFAPVAGAAPFTVVNVHFEYRSRSNRRRSAGLVAERIAPMVATGEALVLVGDLNAMAGSATMAMLEAAGVSFLPVEGSTYHFDRGVNLFGAIDHIGVTPAVRAASAPVVLRRKFGGVWPSDHYPVLADLILP